MAVAEGVAVRVAVAVGDDVAVAKGVAVRVAVAVAVGDGVGVGEGVAVGGGVGVVDSPPQAPSSKDSTVTIVMSANVVFFILLPFLPFPGFPLCFLSAQACLLSTQGPLK